MNFTDLSRARHSVRQYAPGLTISDTELERIFDDVVLSPSSFNLQPWRFVIVREPARKRELRGFAFGQQQVEDCAAAIVVCGHLQAHRDAPRIYADAPAPLRDKFVPMIAAVYSDRPTLQREEAIRGGALAAMSLMYSAKAHGWDTGPMIGFDTEKVSGFLKLDAETVPVMLIVLGKARNGEQPARLHRRPLAEVVRYETLDGRTPA